MWRHALRTGLHAGALLAVTGAVAWVTGTPFVFPGLGPTAYLLATQRPATAVDSPASSPGTPSA